MELIDTSALPAVAWKNGGGTTCTVAVSPAGAGFDDFIWRVSIAEVGQSGGFSLFPGVDRTILLLDGGGMILRGADGSEHALTTPFEPHAMRGEDSVDALLVQGPTHDFNVMVRRGRTQATVSVWRREESLPKWTGEGLFYCARGEFGIGLDGGSVGDGVTLPSGWACRFSSPASDLRIAPNSQDAVLVGTLLESPESEES